jgi:hypothetical protein
VERETTGKTVLCRGTALKDWYGHLFMFAAFTFEAACGLVLFNVGEAGEGRLISYLLIGSGIFGMAATAWQTVRNLNKKPPAADASDRERQQHTTDSPGSGNLL